MLIACWSEPKRSALVFAMKAMRAASFVALDALELQKLVIVV